MRCLTSEPRTSSPSGHLKGLLSLLRPHLRFARTKHQREQRKPYPVPATSLKKKSTFSPDSPSTLGPTWQQMHGTLNSCTITPMSHTEYRSLPTRMMRCKRTSPEKHSSIHVFSIRFLPSQGFTWPIYDETMAAHTRCEHRSIRPRPSVVLDSPCKVLSLPRTAIAYTPALYFSSLVPFQRCQPWR